MRPESESVIGVGIANDRQLEQPFGHGNGHGNGDGNGNGGEDDGGGENEAMRYAWADIYTIELPAGHRFPMEKYRRCRELLLAEGTIRPSQLLEPRLCPREDLERVHTPEYVSRVFEGRLGRDQIRALGFPWSEALVRRSRCSVAGTVDAARRALEDGGGGNFAGGTHHAYPDRCEGFCVFNDVAVAVRTLRAEGRARRFAVVDCDVHQGNGTAFIFRDDPDVFTLSLHARNNWPYHKERSSLDIELDDGTGDEQYLTLLERALGEVERFGSELVFYVAGVDPLAGDRLGRLALTLDGLRSRDRLVLGRAHATGTPIAISFGGGYSESIDDVVEAHANTYRVAESLFPG